MIHNLDIGPVEKSPRIDRLIDNLYRDLPKVESERAVLVTESYKKTEALPIILRRAKALEHILKNMTIVIRDEELIVGNLTTAPRSTSIFPEFSNKWLLDEFSTLEQRTGDPFTIDPADQKALEEIIPYWDGKTVNELATELMFEDTKTAMDHNVFTVGNYYFNGVGHIGVDYEKVLKKGFSGIISEAQDALNRLDKTLPEATEKGHFLEAVIISCSAAIDFAHRFADLAEKMAAEERDPRRGDELRTISANCRRVPEFPAESFYEACQSFWFVQAIIQIESNGHSISPLRFDQYMYPYYKADIDKRRLLKSEAQELLDCLWVKLNDVNKIRDLASTKGFGGYPMFQNLIVGGQDMDGLDATNELSIACLEATQHTKLPQPSISIRVWNGTPNELLIKGAETSRVGLGMPAYYNDEVIIPAMVSRGVSIEDARDYGVIGCVEPQKGGKTQGWHDAAFFNMVKVLELVMNNGMLDGVRITPETGEFSSFTDFDQILDAYQKQMEYCVRFLVNADNSVDIAHGMRAPLPFLSSMADDCIAKGRALENGGAHYNFTGPQGVGVANVGDSLMSIKKLVFEDGKYTLAQIKQAVDDNFGEGGASSDKVRKVLEEVVRRIKADGNSLTPAQLRNIAEVTVKTVGAPEKNADYSGLLNDLDSVPKFGNDLEEPDDLARFAALTYCREVEKYTNPRGGKFQPGLYPVSANVPMGEQTGATPDGRRAGEPLADGVSPVSGRDTNGPTAAANSVAHLDHMIASNGTLFNQKFHPSALSGREGLEKLAALIRGFFDEKGMHVQYNVVSRETLIEAQKHPDKYKGLVVRVAGYSAHFVYLDKSLQDDIINRTEQVF